MGAWKPCNVRNFYPRSPCGERRGYGQYCIRAPGISIHALLAESDSNPQFFQCTDYISIHALLAESDDSTGRSVEFHLYISIHALLAESDTDAINGSNSDLISIHALLAESDLTR